MIYSNVTVAPLKWLKGVTDSGPVVIRTAGGQVGDIGMSVLPEVSFEKGESVTVYLKLGDGGVFSVIGGPAGRVTTHSLFGSAYLGFGDPSGNAQGYKYDGLKWGTDTVSYYINQNGTPDATNEFAAVTAAFQTWENDAGSVIDFNYLGTTGLGINLWDGVNVVAWVAHLPCSPTPCDEGLAATTWRVDPISGNIAEIDLSINDFYVWSDSGEAGKYDIQDAVTHEAGHWLQLAHLTQPGDSEATIWPDVAAGETKKRTLEWGDIAGLRFIYPMTVSATGWFGDSTQGADI